eukprot:877371-Rhodomonas_salina.3
MSLPLPLPLPLCRGACRMPHGRGRMEFDDGSYFEGRWEGGEMSGGGRLIFASSSLGESYDGQMRTSLFDGRGYARLHQHALL